VSRGKRDADDALLAAHVRALGSRPCGNSVSSWYCVSSPAAAYSFTNCVYSFCHSLCRFCDGEAEQHGIKRMRSAHLLQFPPIAIKRGKREVEDHLSANAEGPRTSRCFMPERIETDAGKLNPDQAAELALLVELEARWENLRKTPVLAQDVGPDTYDLRGIQKAYDEFHSKLVTYNKLYTPAHVPERLLNTPLRLAVWCRSMRQLYIAVENDPRVRCPVQLLHKAHRWAERMSLRLNKPRVGCPTPPDTIRTAIEGLSALGEWCDDLMSTRAVANDS